ncbi:MAG TPA: Stf0 family sulfotransferase [Acetobacteraceae bacterium]|nr:Stf0 family sulfotransferase [Acetobacteraceae bacterium]
MIVTQEMRDYPNEHRDRVRAFLGDRFDRPSAIPSAARLGFICYTNRCGSHFLADCLLSTGKLNYAGEWFHADHIIAKCDGESLPDLGAFLGSALNEQQNGLYLSKVSVTQLIMLAEAGILDRIIARSAFIVLERNDKLGQAISYALALGTEQWTSEHEQRTAPEQVPFAPDIVSGFIEGLTVEMMLFDRFFAHNGIVPCHVIYEDLLAAPQQAVARIGAFLGFPGLVCDPARMRFGQQRTAVNEDWRRRYLEWQRRQR